jgi:single-strand DNA-binding protein
MDNSVTVVGNLTRDPELRYTPSGQAVCKLGLAVNRRYQKDGEWKSEPSFLNVNCWRDLAEHAAESLETGIRVIVTGRLQSRSWETEDGQKRTVIEIEAEDIGPSLRWATAAVTRITRPEWEGEEAGQSA